MADHSTKKTIDTQSSTHTLQEEICFGNFKVSYFDVFEKTYTKRLMISSLFFKHYI